MATDLEKAEMLISLAEEKLDAFSSTQPGHADLEVFERIFEMLRELATR